MSCHAPRRANCAPMGLTASAQRFNANHPAEILLAGASCRASPVPCRAVPRPPPLASSKCEHLPIDFGAQCCRLGSARLQASTLPARRRSCRTCTRPTSCTPRLTRTACWRNSSRNRPAARAPPPRIRTKKPRARKPKRRRNPRRRRGKTRPTAARSRRSSRRRTWHRSMTSSCPPAGCSCPNSRTKASTSGRGICLARASSARCGRSTTPK